MILVKPDPIGHLAINGIQCHMDHQTDAKVACAVKKTSNTIQCDGCVCMQGMKANTATRRVIDRIREQMINIHQHGGHHDQVCAFPVISKKHPDDQRRDHSVQYKMKNCLFLSYNRPAWSRP